ncbi:MAG TPA: hypothetical protein VGB49_02840, partial [Caulobacteraceae bacterium]
AAGSTVTPLLAAALLAETPGLADLTVRHPGAGPMERVLGVGFHGDPRSWPREVAGAAPGEWLTVERFLSRSSNRYAASLALLGWAPDPLAANGFPAGGDHALGGPPAERLPMLDVQLQQGADGPGFGPALRAPRWRRHLASLFDTGACRGPDLCDNSPWGPVFLGLPTVDGARPPTQFLAISPQDQDFRFGEMQDFRTQYLPVILGGEAYGWSALRLAQSYARLTTGRLVQARLVRDPRGQPASFGALPLDAGVRARLLAGLEQVVSEGTGAPLRPVLAELQAEAARRGETVRLYAKTGTPEIERLAYSAQEEAENRLIAARLITLDGGLVRIRGVAPRDEADRAEAVARLRADRAAMRLLGPSGRPAAAVGRALAFNRARPSARFGYYRAVQGRLTAVSPRGAADSHFVSALALVVVVSRPGAAEPERAIAVTLNLQEPGRAAAPLAAEMLRGELWPIVFPVRGREARR